MLTQYQQLTQLLLKDPKEEKFNLFDLAAYINIARNQVAGEGECIRVLATVPTVSAQQVYPFTGITVTGTSGVASVLSVRMITTDSILLTPREWEWFNTYYIPAPVAGSPTIWAQYAQGAGGSIYLYPTPNLITNLQADTVCLPIPLVTDSTAEAIPYPWTDAVPYYAAYMAYLTDGNADGAAGMYQLYETFMKRARAQSTPTVLPTQYEGGMGARLAAAQMPIAQPAAPARQAG